MEWLGRLGKNRGELAGRILFNAFSTSVWRGRRGLISFSSL